MKQHLEKSLRGPARLYAQVLVILLVVMLSTACYLTDCENNKPKTSTVTNQVTRPTMHRPKMDITRVPRTDGRVELKIKCTSTGLTANQIWLTGHLPKGASNVQASHDGEYRGGSWPVYWKLPVGLNGQTEEVSIIYTPPAGVDKVVNVFDASGWPYDVNGDTTRRGVTTDLTGSSSKMWGEWNPATSPMAAAVPQDDYYLWETNIWYGTDGLTMTVDLCQDAVDALQPNTAFVALRFPVQPPALAYTDPYTLPVSFRSDALPYLFLLDERAFPITTIITTALEYKPQYLTFAENELPAAPGEHWLTLGAVISPTVDCAGLPELPGGEWEVQAQVWLDFGGVRDTFTGSTLPLYYCYEGQQPPAQLSQALGSDVTSYQGWNTTCLGPHYLTLREDESKWELAGQGGGWITPTQTISFEHNIYNWTASLPLTFTLELSSTLNAGWAVYSDKQGQIPVIGPFRVDEWKRDFWLFGQVPADADAGPYTIVITARTDDAAPASQQISDLIWVGDWVAPPPGPFGGHSIYLPLVRR